MDTYTIHKIRCSILALFAILAPFLASSLANAHGTHAPPQDAHRAVHIESHKSVQPLIQLFRETGDDSYLDTAWAVIEPQLDDERVEPGVLIDAAMLAQSRHDFVLALELLNRALGQRPHLPQAWLLRAAIELVRGNIDEALEACRQLRGSTALVAVTCHARVAIARGDE